MLIAVMSDLHANYPALKAVLAGLEAWEPDLILCAGDLVGYGPHPNEVIGILSERQIPCVKGDFDQAAVLETIAASPDLPYRLRVLREKSLAWTLENISPDSAEYLRGLPRTLSFSARGRHVFLAHASPRNATSGVTSDRPAANLRRMFDQTQAHIMLLGHTHLPFHRVIEGRHLVNAGSVGRPLDGDYRASYALLEINDRVRVEIQRVDYDIEETVTDMREAGLPEALITGLSGGKL